MKIERLTGRYNGYALKPHRGLIEKFTLQISSEGKVILNAVDFEGKGTITFKDQNAFIIVQSEQGNQIQYVFFIGKKNQAILIGVYSGVSVSGNIAAGRVLLEKVEKDSTPRYISLDKMEESDFLHSKFNQELINKYLIELSKKEQQEKSEPSIESLQILIQDLKDKFENEISNLKENQEKIIIDLQKQINRYADQKDWKIELKKLIGNGHLEEAIEEILKTTLDISSSKYNEAISLNARLSQLEIEFRIGILSDENRRIEKSKINQALLKLIDTIIFRK